MSEDFETQKVNVKVQRFYVTCPLCSNIITSIQGEPRGFQFECDKCFAKLEISHNVDFE